MEFILLAALGYFYYYATNKNQNPVSVTPVIPNQTNNNWINQNNENKLAGVNPMLASKIRQLINLAQSNGYTLYIDEGYRTQERQNQLYAQGRTTAGAIVTNTLTSKHTQGKAVDIMPVINGQPSNSLTAFNWNLIGVWAQSIGLTWGGNWKSLKDYRHLEI
jgi:peptidoglycan LD-endopeptidase CwlK